MATNESLKLVDEALQAGNCGWAIRYMENYLAAWPEQHTSEKLAQVREDYSRMESYWQQGGEDHSAKRSTNDYCSGCMCSMPMSCTTTA